jgi:hypothetical protein
VHAEWPPRRLSFGARVPAQVSCRITITKMMTTRTPMMVPISPLLIAALLSLTPDDRLNRRLSPSDAPEFTT